MGPEGVEGLTLGLERAYHPEAMGKKASHAFRLKAGQRGTVPGWTNTLG
jgi:hypothetical protein